MTRVMEPTFKEIDSKGVVNGEEEEVGVSPLNPTTKTTGLPKWCKPFPSGFQVPRGKRVVVLRFRASWTDRPDLGDRQCVIWPLSVGDERVADQRAGNDAARGLPERSKQSIRLVDGGPESPTLVELDFTKTNAFADPDRFWDQIGMKCRNLLMNQFLKMHGLDDEERADFIESCVVVLDAV